MINPEDAAKHLISEGDYVCLESPRGKVDVKAKITDQVKSGVVSTTFHFPDIMINNITGNMHVSEAMFQITESRVRSIRRNYCGENFNYPSFLFSCAAILFICYSPTIRRVRLSLLISIIYVLKVCKCYP
ncbi:MAG: hypothetical protein ACJATI_000058 [Halioglobus sp.]|jgi:hypothetical protein